MTDDTPDAAPSRTAPASRASVPPPYSRARLEGYFRAAVFTVLLVIGAIATMRAYLALENSITVWLRHQWVPVAQAAFSIVIVAACVWLIRAWVLSRGE